MKQDDPTMEELLDRIRKAYADDEAQDADRARSLTEAYKESSKPPGQ
jgi:uncharacterized protein YyaL (SSP411 family)